MSNTPRLGIPELTAGQAIPETTENEAKRYLEQGAGFFIVIDKTLTAPPGSPAEGDAHIVAATATGAWTGKEKNIAFYMGGAWSFVAPIEGTHANCQADDTTYRYSGSAWVAVTASGALLIANNLSDLGSASTARTNLGLGTAAVAASSSFLQVSSNLSDLANAATARTNLDAACRTPQIQSVASSATVIPTFADDQVIITAQAAGLTLATPTGTALDGWGLVIRIKDNGTARSISYGTQYRAIGVTLPSTTVISKTLYLGMIFNNADTKWDVVAVAQEA